MNPFIKQQLKQVKNNIVKAGDNITSVHDLTGLEKEIIFSKSYNEIDYNSYYLFTFNNHLIKNLNIRGNYNQEFITESFIPLKIMKGKILSITDGVYFLELVGIKLKTESCLRCLKFGAYEPICDKCRSELQKEVTEVVWKGSVSKLNIKKIEKLIEE